MKIKHTHLIKNILVMFVTVMALSPRAYSQAAADAAVWIDARSAAEYQTGHLENAYNIPYTEIANRIN